MHMEAQILASKFLGKCGVYWSQFADEIEFFHIHLVTTTYGSSLYSSGKAECWAVVLTMVRGIWMDLRKVSVLSETAYGSEYQSLMVG